MANNAKARDPSDGAAFSETKAAQFLGIEVAEFIGWRAFGLGPRLTSETAPGGGLYMRSELEAFIAQGGIERAHAAIHC